jgi:hypothetical protein
VFDKIVHELVFVDYSLYYVVAVAVAVVVGVGFGVVEMVLVVEYFDKNLHYHHVDMPMNNY